MVGKLVRMAGFGGTAIKRFGCAGLKLWFGFPLWRGQALAGAKKFGGLFEKLAAMVGFGGTAIKEARLWLEVLVWIPAFAGMTGFKALVWIPAFAGMTGLKLWFEPSEKNLKLFGGIDFLKNSSIN